MAIYMVLKLFWSRPEQSSDRQTKLLCNPFSLAAGMAKKKTHYILNEALHTKYFVFHYKAMRSMSRLLVKSSSPQTEWIKR